MSLDGRLVGVDSDEYEDYYQGKVQSICAALAERGVDTSSFVLGKAGQTYADEIGKSSALHLLRSYAAAVAVHKAPPEEPDFSVIGHELNEMYKGQMPFTPFEHLIKHSDADGFYIPIDFAEPFDIGEPGEEFWACSLGSSKALLRELDELNKHLKMPGDLGELSGSARVRQVTEGDVFATEKFAWAVLRWLARESVEKNLLFEFC